MVFQLINDLIEVCLFFVFVACLFVLPYMFVDFVSRSSF